MKKEDGEIVCNECGESLGFYESDCEIHYCTSCSGYHGPSYFKFNYMKYVGEENK